MAKGYKTGGRTKGTPNKLTAQVRQKINLIKASGKDPMSFFLDILRDENAPHTERKEAASELLPYFHPKLASIEARTGGTTHEQRLAELQAMISDDEEADGQKGGEG